MKKQQANSLIKEQVANVLFNSKGVTAVYPTDTSAVSKRKTALEQSKWYQGVAIEWISVSQVNITVTIDVPFNVTTAVSYNLIKNLLTSAFKKIPKINLNNLYLKIEDIREKTINGK